MRVEAIGGFDDARRHGEAILALARRADRPREIVVAHNKLTWHDIRVGDLAGSDRRLRTVARLAADPGDARLQAVALANSADVARLGGRYRMAVETGRRALALLAEVGDPGHRVRAHGVVGLALAGAGDVDEAEMVRKSLVEAGAGAAGIRALIGGYVALRR